MCVTGRRAQKSLRLGRRQKKLRKKYMGRRLRENKASEKQQRTRSAEIGRWEAVQQN